MVRVLVAMLCTLAACGGQGVRDVAVEGTDVRAERNLDAGRAAETYAYVAERQHVSLGLAEARRIASADANEIVDRLATEFDRCAEQLAREGKLPSGTGRVVAVTNERGQVTGLSVRTEPGAEVTRVVYLCLVAPLRATAFPTPTAAGVDGKPQGIALEAAWKSGP